MRQRAGQLHSPDHRGKDGKESTLFVDGSTPRHEGNHRVLIIHNIRKELASHARFDPRQFRAERRYGTSVTGIIAMLHAEVELHNRLPRLS